MPTWTRNPGLLEGVRLLELAGETASFCGKLLSDLGADVVKVERPSADSVGEVCCPEARDAPSFVFQNTKKRSITLDIEQPEGRRIFLALVGRADGVLESFPPGRLELLGLGYEALSAANPGVVLASVTGYGSSGPRRDWKACDLTAAAAGGQAYVTGLPEREPLKLFGSQALYLASLHAAVGVLQALIRRTTSGRGDRVEVSVQEAVASGLDHVMVRFFSEGTVAGRTGGRHWNDYAFVSPCADGHIEILPFDQWHTLLEWMADEGMADDLTDSRFLDPQYRRANFAHVAEVIARWTRGHTKAELFETAQLMRLPWAPVCDLHDVLASSQLAAREFFSREVGDANLQPRPPYLFLGEGQPLQDELVPALGQDNERVYREELGMSADELRQLASAGVI